MHLARLFHRSVAMHGDRPALARGGDPPLTYRALDRRVRALGQWMRHDLGLVPGDRIALAMPNAIEYAESMLAAWHAELCAVPINHRLHAREVAWILGYAGARACVATGPPLASLREACDACAWLDPSADAWREAREGPMLSSNPDAPLDDHALAWLFYTSGTTGRPKGVMLTHANLVAMALNFQADLLAIDERDALVHVAPMSHGSGLYAIPYWMQGGLQVVPSSGGFDETELVALLGALDRASFFAAPTIVARLVAHLRASNASDACHGLRCILVGGAPFYVEDIKAAVACLGPRVAQLYGQGESPMTITALRAGRIADAVASSDDALLASVGFEQTTVEVVIVDAAGARVPDGTPGEVTVRSPTVMAGYWTTPQRPHRRSSKGRYAPATSGSSTSGACSI